MKMLVAAALCSMLLTVSTVAIAADGKGYVGISAGLFIPNESTMTDDVGDTAKATFKPGALFSGALGYAAGNGLRMEAELAYRSGEMDKLKIMDLEAKVDSDVSVTSLMANVYYDIKTGSFVTPYVGAGLGIAKVDVGKGTFRGVTLWESDDDTVMAYQIAAGVGFAVSQNVTIDLGYRFFGTQNAQFEFTDAEVSSHNVTLGARFLF